MQDSEDAQRWSDEKLHRIRLAEIVELIVVWMAEHGPSEILAIPAGYLSEMRDRSGRIGYPSPPVQVALGSDMAQVYHKLEGPFKLEFTSYHPMYFAAQSNQALAERYANMRVFSEIDPRCAGLVVYAINEFHIQRMVAEDGSADEWQSCILLLRDWVGYLRGARPDQDAGLSKRSEFPENDHQPAPSDVNPRAMRVRDLVRYAVVTWPGKKAPALSRIIEENVERSVSPEQIRGAMNGKNGLKALEGFISANGFWPPGTVTNRNKS